jgi:hypothetical protein
MFPSKHRWSENDKLITVKDSDKGEKNMQENGK